MKRMHMHINVEAVKFDASVAFYSTMFGSAPTTVRPQYAKWMLDDPRVNFTVEVMEIDGDVPGLHHVGIQVDEDGELETMRNALSDASAPLLEVGRTECCFAASEKNWTADPQGVRWETFRSFGELDSYGAKTTEELDLYTKRVTHGD